MKKQGFTLVELLVVIAIIALLMGILMPALSRVRQLAFRMVCGTNLSGIGKAMLIYANDYDDELPKAGDKNAVLTSSVVWDALSRGEAYAITPTKSDATISSCFYLLVKYTEVTPKSFVCKSDTGTTPWELSDEPIVRPDMEMVEAWDFGSNPYERCSYAYHWPFGTFALTTSSEPALAIAADRNPWQVSPAGAAKPDTMWASFDPRGGTEAVRAGNSMTHQEDGQNVLFMDAHVDFAKTSACSLEEDNIYTLWVLGTNEASKGVRYTSRDTGPRSRKDSLLLHNLKGRACFAAGTLVWVDGAMLPIAKVAAGQGVGHSADMATLNEIELVQEHPGRWTECHDVILETGDCITVVGSHLFRVAEGLWVSVQQLRRGVSLETMNGVVEVAWVVRRTVPYVGTVYNLKIKDADEYFVGKAGVVVRDF